MLVVIVELPNGVEAPTSRELANLAVIACDNQGALIGKHARVASAGLPPASGGVEKRIAASLGVVGVDKVVDPVSHGSLAKAVAGVAVGAILEVKHT